MRGFNPIYLCLFATCCEMTACQKPPETPIPTELAAPAPSEEKPSSSSRWVTATMAADQVLFEAPAVVLLATDNDAVSSVPSRARVLQSLVRQGDQVSVGQPLLEVTYPDLAIAASTLVAAKERLQSMRQRREQIVALRSEGMMRASDLFDIEIKLQDAKASAAQAHALLMSAGLDPNKAASLSEKGGRTYLLSPITGTVTDVFAVIGQTYEPGSTTLLRIAGNRGGRIEARLPARLPDSLQDKNIECLFVTGVQGIGGSSVVLRLVTQVEDREQGAGGVRAWFEPVDKKLILTPSLRGRVVLQMPAGAPGIRIPSSALISNAGKSEGVSVRVQQMRDGQMHEALIPVTVLFSIGSEAVVSGVLNAGDKVAL